MHPARRSIPPGKRRFGNGRRRRAAGHRTGRSSGRRDGSVRTRGRPGTRGRRTCDGSARRSGRDPCRSKYALRPPPRGHTSGARVSLHPSTEVGPCDFGTCIRGGRSSRGGVDAQAATSAAATARRPSDEPLRIVSRDRSVIRGDATTPTKRGERAAKDGSRRERDTPSRCTDRRATRSGVGSARSLELAPPPEPAGGRNELVRRFGDFARTDSCATSNTNERSPTHALEGARNTKEND